ncbi:hypothetical protein COT75_01070 [Candidatus Beckwithbacteria bacterium CG10_big_fil_rev_8_21_14_0_10_34_10]|uniref:Uncharacterized protein n=1 Tax=Candidatus Beckwithbacteria bacterium CG10_big_fil_rev_8_21_14_0_10_34_10 TaxID=1974495 RepID=A0A2H0WA39_9BACT|nr:MAG: hypothetical protein COT75_01070 [Candidatus Beckwithbacteria bacterium CG10_big_fil_rev_8_21_14_0_10_34_10]
MKKSKDCSLGLIAFLQALGLVLYCSLIGLIFWKGNQWFGNVPNFEGPLLFLTLFATSCLVCALLTLGYPAILIWKKKQVGNAIKLIAYTVLYLLFFIIFFLLVRARTF